MTLPRIEALGDQGLVLVLAERIDPTINARIHRLASRLREASPPWLLDCVPAYASLAIFVAREAHPGRGDPLPAARSFLHSLLAADDGDQPEPKGATNRHEIPVCYEGGFAPDLPDIARHCGLSVEEVITRHHAADYRVAMLGFAAGFPYLLGLDPALAMPRLSTPRTQVPAGSVGIGGTQTGVYPRTSPGGWRLVGRTPLCLFDAMRRPASLLAPGDGLRFVRIGAAEFARMEAALAKSDA